MNEQIKQLAMKAEGTKKHVPAVWQFYDYELENFVQLIVDQQVALLQQRWYDLNNQQPEPNETPRDVGMRVGRKSELILMIELLKNHFKEKQ